METLNILHKSGVNIFKTDEHGQDIVEIAIQNQNIKVLNLCSQLGYHFGVMHDNGKFPIIMAAESGFSLVANFLILKGVNCNVRRSKDWASPLLIAAENGYLELLMTLIDVCDLYAVNLNGENLMHIAVLNHQAQTVNYLSTLKEFETLIKMPDKLMGYTPLELIVIQNNQEIAKLLIDLGFSFEMTASIKTLLTDTSPVIQKLFRQPLVHEQSIFNPLVASDSSVNFSLRPK